MESKVSCVVVDFLMWVRQDCWGPFVIFHLKKLQITPQGGVFECAFPDWQHGSLTRFWFLKWTNSYFIYMVIFEEHSYGIFVVFSL